MSDLTPTSRLEAVNQMLRTIGEAPVSTLTGDLTVDVVTADQVLSQVLKDVLSQGWFFNTEHDYPLSKNGSNEIIVPTDILAVDVRTTDNSKLNVVIRGQKLYDLTEHTTVFTQDVSVSIVRLLNFEDIPQSAKSYIMHRASRLFQASMLGSDSLAREASTNEIQALAALKLDEDEQADRTVFDSYAVARALYR